MQQKRETNISTLAFIDVMACGLGAVILLFFILDFDEEPIPQIIKESTVDDRIVKLENKYGEILAAKASKLDEIKELKKR